MSTLFDPLLLPDQVRLSRTDRESAAAKLDHAVRRGTLTPPGAASRRDLLHTARTRGELRQVFDGVDGALPPSGLTVGMRGVTAIWLITGVVQFVVWLTLAAFGNLDWPWWLFSTVGLGLAVGILWWTHESYHRKTDVQPAEYALP
jgi:hypothetical protein